MMINTNNYELYAIDYIDGTLDKDARREMDEFLKNHPLIQQEIEALRNPVILTADNTITYQPKAELKKTEKKNNALLITLLKYAAVAAFMLGTLFWFNKIELTPDPVANNTPAINNDEGIAGNKIPEDNTVRIPKTELTTPSDPVTPSLNNKTDINQNPISDKPNVVKRNNENIINTNTTSTVENTITEETIIKTTQPTIVPIPKLIIPEKTATLASTPSAPSINKETAMLELKQDKFNIPLNTLATINDQTRNEKKKGQWLLNAITKKSNGNNLFAFEGVKRALTPTRLRDGEVDKSSTDSPIKQLTND